MPQDSHPERAKRREIQNQLEDLMREHGWRLKDRAIPVAGRSSWTARTKMNYQVFLALRRMAANAGIPVSDIREEYRRGEVVRVEPRRRRIEAKPTYIYMTHQRGNLEEWKFGRSHQPVTRTANLNTGNPNDLIFRLGIGPWPIKSAVKIEGAIKAFTRKRSPKDATRAQEWRRLRLSYVESLLEVVNDLADEIIAHGPDPLFGQYVTPSRKGPCPARVDPLRKPRTK